MKLAALALAVAVVAGEVAAGGGDFVPTPPFDPCRARPITSTPATLDRLSEAVVVLGTDGTACRMHVTREALVLRLARGEHRADDADAMRAGLRQAVDRLDKEHRLPKASALSGEALDTADLNPLVRRALKALPDSVVDLRIQTDDLLRRTVARLDLDRLLANLTDPDAVQAQVSSAVRDSVQDEILEGLPRP
jgi:hypothetical protein